MSAPAPSDAAVAVTLPGPLGQALSAICIDTATAMASLALLRDGEVLGEVAWQAGSTHTRQLAGALRRLAADAGYNFAETSVVCVCTGPGSFNGIRAGMATASGLAFGLGVPIYGCSALDLLAFPHADRAPAQRALLPAGRGEFYSALFGTRGGRWRRVSPYSVETLEALAAETPAKSLWCGPLKADEATQLAELLGGSRRLVPPAHNVRRAAYLLPLALAAAAAGAPGTAQALAPLYLRRPSITTPRAAALAGVS